MVEEVKEILRNDVEVVIKSPQLSLSLLRCASAIYLNGKAPGTCAKTQRKFYRYLLKDGIMKAELMEKVKARTCQPAWKGLLYNRKACKHYSDALMHDEEAINALEKGYLTESQFEVLPEGYNKVAAVVKEGYNKVNTSKKRRGRKPKNNQ